MSTDFEDVRNEYESIQPIQTIRDGEPLADLLRVTATLLDRLDDDITALEDQKYIATADRDRLELLGANIQLDPKTGEATDTYRRRLAAAYVAALSRGTYGDIAETTLVLFDTSPGNVSLRPARETTAEATAVVEVPSAIINDAPFTQTEAENIIRRAATGGHRIVLQKADVFTWDDANNGWGTQWSQHSE
jgi:hypothetical protein